MTFAIKAYLGMKEVVEQTKVFEEIYAQPTIFNYYAKGPHYECLGSVSSAQPAHAVRIEEYIQRGRVVFCSDTEEQKSSSLAKPEFIIVGENVDSRSCALLREFRSRMWMSKPFS